MLRGPKFEMGHVTLSHPLLGQFVIHWPVLAVNNLSIKFEMCCFTTFTAGVILYRCVNSKLFYL